MSAMFRSFSVFNYRVWFIGALVSNIGAWMQATAISWVVLTELTDNDPAAMGITMALQFAPPLLLVRRDRLGRRPVRPRAGSWSSRRRCCSCSASRSASCILAGGHDAALMYAFALALGVVAAFDNPARQAFVSDLVARENASNAVALNAASFNGARMIGPAVAGIVIVAVGTGWVFLVNGVTFLGMIVALAPHPHRRARPPRASARAPVASPTASATSAKRPDLIVTFAMVFLLGAFGMNFPIFASTMAIEFGQEADGYGLLSSILAIGSLAGALLAARRDRARIRVVVGGTLLFAVAATVSAFMPTYWLYAVTLMVTGSRS